MSPPSRPASRTHRPRPFREPPTCRAFVIPGLHQSCPHPSSVASRMNLRRFDSSVHRHVRRFHAPQYVAVQQVQTSGDVQRHGILKNRLSGDCGKNRRLGSGCKKERDLRGPPPVWEYEGHTRTGATPSHDTWLSDVDLRYRTRSDWVGRTSRFQTRRNVVPMFRLRSKP